MGPAHGSGLFPLPREGKEQIIIYKVGDYVAHPGHGGCTIQGISKRVFGGVSKTYFVMVPKTDPQTTILAPVENMEKIGLRGIISEEQADQLLTYYTNVEVDWVPDHSKRKQSYEEILKSGHLDSIAKMIKELTVHETEAPLNHSDKEMLPKARKKLFSEIALAKGVDYEHVLSMTGCAVH